MNAPQAAPTVVDPLSALSRLAGEADWIGLRFVEETSQHRAVRNGRPERNQVHRSHGAMIEAVADGQLAYAATSDLSETGLRDAACRAVRLARASARHAAAGFSEGLRPAVRGEFAGPCEQGFDALSLAELTAKLVAACARLRVSDRIVETSAAIVLTEHLSHYLTSSGADIEQRFHLISQNFMATARNGPEIQRRSLNGPVARCLQGGLEVLDFERIFEECERAGREALELLDADDCPDDTRDLLLAPDQMLLQIHESVGHPLELDRILGDERNYAGWSFVKPEDFGRLQYGSPLMNISFDPTLPSEFASYGFDDCGNRADRQYLIRNGLLLRGLGSLESQARLGLPGVANFRSAGWNRAPIDRMANLNLDPGDSTLDEMIASVERGIYMSANRSWSIDDYRRKFQFGCEYARLIEDGRLTRVVRNPNYRGVSIPFWHSLKMVGNRESFGIFGTPFCGKGEPNQMIRVGHASPHCLFSGVEIFGGGR
ncbi:TldD/PmbA family protein [Methylococcus geothermalis]|uniref:TldD/PmbA family protein n=1 Tax=Methylococcus geothermalis TaxID=2681310 RepID=A0A858Q625_9GAMM|nr:TldD/PmbA family protein [Methylococcus geothermalis]QJD29255.1 TldD/PmbA family protein [Methylococcus geothermalis]